MTLFFSLLHFFLSLLLNISSPSSFPFATSLSFDLAETWADRWTTSTGKEDLGAFKLTAGKYYNDEAADAGLQTSEDAKFYGSLTGFDTFGTEGKTLFVQVRANDAAQVFPRALFLGGSQHVPYVPSLQHFVSVDLVVALATICPSHKKKGKGKRDQKKTLFIAQSCSRSCTNTCACKLACCWER